jgi:hypothetical protein
MIQPTAISSTPAGVEHTSATIESHEQLVVAETLDADTTNTELSFLLDPTAEVATLTHAIVRNYGEIATDILPATTIGLTSVEQTLLSGHVDTIAAHYTEEQEEVKTVLASTPGTNQVAATALKKKTTSLTCGVRRSDTMTAADGDQLAAHTVEKDQVAATAQKKTVGLSCGARTGDIATIRDGTQEEDAATATADTTLREAKSTADDSREYTDEPHASLGDSLQIPNSLNTVPVGG